MISFIRSLSELMAITESRKIQKDSSQYNETYYTIMDSGQRKRYKKSLEKNQADLPDLPKSIRGKWIQNKESISRFINELDYNNQIQSSYDLILIERQSTKNQHDVA